MGIVSFDSDFIQTRQVSLVAFVFCAVSIICSSIHVLRHLFNYSMPGIQIYVIRILFICPIYAITSCVAIVLGENGLYAETVRDVYEAFVLYSFLNLVLEFCGGESDCIYMIENEPMLRMPFPLCFLPGRPRDARLIRFCQRGVLQFIIIKPIMAVLTVIMIATNNIFNPVYVIVEAVVYNISYGWALYCMYVFYLATHQLIKKFKPILKFATVKVFHFFYNIPA